MRGNHSTLLHETDMGGSFEEFSYVVGDASVAVLAPHGGQVEPNTDTQAFLIQKSAPINASVWGTRGLVNGSYNDAYSRWHTTADTHPLDAFPLYQDIVNHEYEFSISLHAMSGDGIIIGGQSSESVRESLKDALSVVFSEVSIASEGDDRAGMKDENFVNSIDAKQSIHIEQSLEIATTKPKLVARIISDWLQTQLGSE